MELKPGYKQTEVGVIPEDWAVRSLEGIADPKCPICYGIVQVGVFVSSGIPVLAIKNLNTDYCTNVHQCLPEIEALYARSRIRPGDILVSVKGTTGRVGIVPSHFDGNISRDLARIRLSDYNVPEFWFQMLQSETAQRKLNVASVGTTRLELSIGILKQVMMPCPLSDEQRAIAAALSDVDALIVSLDKLIAKKRDIKQAAMQLLLTGKKRLPGFIGAWEVKRLGDIFEITSSKRVFQSEWRSEGIPFYRARELAVLGEAGRVDNDLFISRDLYEKHRRAYGVPSVGDMLATGVGTLGKVFVVPDDREFYFKDGNIIWFQIGGSMSADFLRQLYLTPQIMKQITEGAAGTTVGTYTITAARKTTIPFPSLHEQTAIANVISDMDAEITALEARRDKTKLLKQAMMQELLTGKTRLVTPGGPNA